MKQAELVHISTADGLQLPGLLYKVPRSKAVAIYLHGNGSSSVFYENGPRPELAQALARRGVSLLLFNNRGAHLMKKLTVKRKTTEERRPFGMAYEKIKDCIYDIDAAINLLRHRGFRTFYLIGESTGANKICVYDHYKARNPVAKYVLLGGGDDTGIYYHALGKKKFWKTLRKAKRMIKSRRGDEIAPELLPQFVFSYTAFYDIANPDGEYNTFPFLEEMKNLNLSTKKRFRYFCALKKPTLVAYGEFDKYGWGDVPRLVTMLQAMRPDFSYRILTGADHTCSAHQPELGRLIAAWFAKPQS